MNKSKYTKNFEVHYYEVDQHGAASTDSILNYLEETAISHSSAVGIGIDELQKDGVVWVLNRWMIKMEKYPGWGESVIVETWPSWFERFYGRREFLIKGSNGEVYGRASSLWIFLDVEKKRPTRIPERFGELYGIDSKRAVENDFVELGEIKHTEFTKEFAVRRGDIDTNAHVNNIRYVDWILEAIPQEVYDGYKLDSLDMVYKREAKFGDEVVCISAKEGENKFLHNILNKQDGTLLASAATKWAKE